MKKYNLSDVTFLLIIRIDTINRLENILAVTKFLTLHFNTNIRLLECSRRNNGLLKKLINPAVEYAFHEDYDPVLHRTYYLNQMLSKVTTPFVAIWDADVISSKNQVIKAVEFLRNNEADFVYPYIDYLLDTSEVIRDQYLKSNNYSVLSKYRKWMKEMYPPDPVGGAFFCNLSAYKDSGLENEQFYGWGVEDGERYRRWKKSGYRIKRVKGCLFHLSHPRGINSLLHHRDQSIIKTRILKESECRAGRKLFSQKI